MLYLLIDVVVRIARLAARNLIVNLFFISVGFWMGRGGGKPLVLRGMSELNDMQNRSNKSLSDHFLTI